LAKDLIHRLKAMRKQIKEIRGLHTDVVKKYRAALLERIQKSRMPISGEDERLIKEVTFFADRSDGVRKNSPASKAISRNSRIIFAVTNRSAARSSSSPRKFFRELNTLGAKGNDAAISQRVVVLQSRARKNSRTNPKP